MENMSNPHPEAREDALDFASRIEAALTKGEWRHVDLANRIEMYVESRLARKDEGQTLTVEQVGWLRMVLGRALYRVEHFPGQSNDEDIEADELARAIILLGGEPAASEPSLAAQKDEGQRDALEDIITAYDDESWDDPEEALSKIMGIARAALREPDGRKGE